MISAIMCKYEQECPVICDRNSDEYIFNKKKKEAQERDSIYSIEVRRSDYVIKLGTRGDVTTTKTELNRKEFEWLYNHIMPKEK